MSSPIERERAIYDFFGKPYSSETLQSAILDAFQTENSIKPVSVLTALNKDIQKAFDCNIHFLAASGISIGIDILSQVWEGKPQAGENNINEEHHRSKKRFKQFCKEYLIDKTLDFEVQEHCIWGLRNGLLHDYRPSNQHDNCKPAAKYILTQSGLAFSKKDDHTVIINIRELNKRLLAAKDELFNEVVKEKSKINDRIKIIEQFGFISIGNYTIADNHTYLADASSPISYRPQDL